MRVSGKGGKRTTYRLTAQRVLAQLVPQLPPARTQRDTAQIPLRLG
jgi:glycerol-3-phosphate dehydrogenase